MKDKLDMLFKECIEQRKITEIKLHHIDKSDEKMYNRYLNDVAFNNGQMDIIRKLLDECRTANH